MLVGYAHAAAARRAGARLARRAGRPSRPRGGRRGPRWRGLRRGQTKARCARARSARTRAREAGEEEWVVAGRWERRGGESGSSTRGSGGWLGRGLGRQRPAGSLRGSGTKCGRTHAHAIYPERAPTRGGKSSSRPNAASRLRGASTRWASRTPLETSPPPGSQSSSKTSARLRATVVVLFGVSSAGGRRGCRPSSTRIG